MSALWWEAGLDWSDRVDWWQHPATAYLKGLQDGARLERERQAREDDAAHRAAARRLLRIVEVAEARERRPA